jgi:hypothetical protein
MMGRWIRFLLAILIGGILGALYGWVVHPVKPVSAPPGALRIDYRSDYVMMVAETYHADQDLAMAVQRLALLGNDPPTRIVQQALLFAEPRYTDADITLIRSLSDALEAWNSALEKGTQ